MSAIHLILTGKGGVGKTFVSTLLAQFLMGGDDPLYCADTDPSNPTFSGYPAFKAQHINIMTPAMNIDKSRFDELIDVLLEHEGPCVVDNGSSSFLPMMAYMLENDVVQFLQDSGKTVYIHAVMVGGLGMDETLRCVDTLLKSQVAPLVVWENELYGPVEKDGRFFLDSAIYKNNKDRILGVVRIVSRGEDTFGKDMKAMTSGRLTFAEAISAPAFRTMSKQRLATVWRDVSQQLDAVQF